MYSGMLAMLQHSIFPTFAAITLFLFHTQTESQYVNLEAAKDGVVFELDAIVGTEQDEEEGDD
jgi:hypothetical protein